MNPTKILISKTVELNKLYPEGLKKLAKKHSVTPAEMKNIIENPKYVPPADCEELGQDIRDFMEGQDIFMLDILDEFEHVKGFNLGTFSILASYIETLEPNQIRSLSCKKLSDIVLFLDISLMKRIVPKLISKEQEEFFEEFSLSVFKGLKPN